MSATQTVRATTASPTGQTAGETKLEHDLLGDREVDAVMRPEALIPTLQRRAATVRDV
ncbi:hypothetical protein SAMN06264364_118104 [Quadrisphaera granulorum]|uniref:Uncharacterized protein n=1 Tax=Quadrisphaera granulorum TaxID=317664 RepID=A0A316A666_9ACTN|nr:hypothetical protein [Quadrisphaera granulorum]PWJ52728.1 hypothetical protein BXY45_118104 [Quadrisphaera granulorum]SZE97550.1 hypothetical protein SAMN06264364_118104 [Quadrisphaera granulorum]